MKQGYLRLVIPFLFFSLSTSPSQANLFTVLLLNAEADQLSDSAYHILQHLGDTHGFDVSRSGEQPYILQDLGQLLRFDVVVYLETEESLLLDHREIENLENYLRGDVRRPGRALIALDTRPAYEQGVKSQWAWYERIRQQLFQQKETTSEQRPELLAETDAGGQVDMQIGSFGLQLANPFDTGPGGRFFFSQLIKDIADLSRKRQDAAFIEQHLLEALLWTTGFQDKPPHNIRLLDLSAHPDVRDIRLQWHANLSKGRFDLLRSRDGKIWESVFQMDVYGEKWTAKSYQYVDQELAPGRYIYQIRQIGLNQKSILSKPIVVEIGRWDPKVSIYPNPVQHEITVSLLSDTSREIKLLVENGKGQRILPEREIKLENQQEIQVNVRELPAGLYQMRIISGRKEVIRNFVKYD